MAAAISATEAAPAGLRCRFSSLGLNGDGRLEDEQGPYPVFTPCIRDRRQRRSRNLEDSYGYSGGLGADATQTALTVCFEGGWPNALYRSLRNETFLRWEAAEGTPNKRFDTDPVNRIVRPRSEHPASILRDVRQGRIFA